MQERALSQSPIRGSHRFIMTTSETRTLRLRLLDEEAREAIATLSDAERDRTLAHLGGLDGSEDSDEESETPPT